MTQFAELLTDTATLIEVGRRLKKRRLSLDLSQSFVAQQTGLSRSTIERLERGKSIQLLGFIAVLRVLGLQAGLEELLLETLPPLEQARLEALARRKASKRKPKKTGKEWFES